MVVQGPEGLMLPDVGGDLGVWVIGVNRNGGGRELALPRSVPVALRRDGFDLFIRRFDSCFAVGSSACSTDECYVGDPDKPEY